ncbi:MAG: hypothetical protein NZ524_09850 [Thiobacillaceae bacterium]|nr:hypothetical protein [Thiobacillaceae bacterium]MCX7672510.1 hypothetical protein [Thiobacillaceae bacterium]MDW8324220.1 hypothetical protein [Burkholderiales bacterium]
MRDPGADSGDEDPPTPRQGELEQLLDGLERQREDLGPIADELLDLLRPLARQGPKASTP